MKWRVCSIWKLAATYQSCSSCVRWRVLYLSIPWSMQLPRSPELLLCKALQITVAADYGYKIQLSAWGPLNIGVLDTWCMTYWRGAIPAPPEGKPLSLTATNSVANQIYTYTLKYFFVFALANVQSIKRHYTGFCELLVKYQKALQINGFQNSMWLAVQSRIRGNNSPISWQTRVQ